MSSEYEKIVVKLIKEKLDELEYLKKAKDWNKSRAQRLADEIETLESLFENYNLGMNYFRRAKGGRSGLRE
jgi:sulfur relay (sulfurtransferase) DsrC/TusE family protein